MSKSEGCDISPDKRGRHHYRPTAMSSETENSVIEHINLYPRVESHYLRARTKREYLEEGLTIQKMFDSYKPWVEVKKPDLKRANLRQYTDIFNSKFNISFFKPKKDRCNICETWKNAQDLDDKKSELYLKLEKNNKEHKSNAKLARKIKEDAIKNFHDNKENSKDLCVGCIDYKKSLPIPRSETNAFYYKRKIGVSNFTIYDIGRHLADCYCYDETVGKKGSNEVGSFLYDYFKKNIAKGIHKFELFADNCSGQNRNRFVCGLLVFAGMTFEKFQIILNFLQCGHTQMEGDSVHALIERRSTGKDIYTPDMWYDIIRNAKRDKKPYRVIEVKKNMIFNLKKLILNQKCTFNTEGKKIAWSKLKAVRCDSDHPGKLFYKTDYKPDTEWSELDILSDPQIRCIKKFHLDNAYLQDLKISSVKYKDLKSLCDSLAIPVQYQDYYKKLVPENKYTPKDVIDESDEEESLAAALEQELEKKPKQKKIEDRAVEKKATKRKIDARDSTSENTTKKLKAQEKKAEKTENMAENAEKAEKKPAKRKINTQEPTDNAPKKRKVQEKKGENLKKTKKAAQKVPGNIETDKKKEEASKKKNKKNISK